ncbi:Uu.00g117510.m01.CDS01 [Anthostomella pinea]|uniref:Uu.00g117510.m01.CDS01 n=1 Tax=Anthostomella pinea TaxID=933095 RepID=A0AAI8VB05_9PEZI|nr:Uu.00g117510.m01.CDS01 [Anthostomella pinea]
MGFVTLTTAIAMAATLVSSLGHQPCYCLYDRFACCSITGVPPNRCRIVSCCNWDEDQCTVPLHLNGTTFNLTDFESGAVEFPAVYVSMPVVVSATTSQSTAEAASAPMMSSTPIPTIASSPSAPSHMCSTSTHTIPSSPSAPSPSFAYLGRPTPTPSTPAVSSQLFRREVCKCSGKKMACCEGTRCHYRDDPVCQKREEGCKCVPNGMMRCCRTPADGLEHCNFKENKDCHRRAADQSLDAVEVDEVDGSEVVSN